jgi:hypothetical protein
MPPAAHQYFEQCEARTDRGSLTMRLLGICAGGVAHASMLRDLIFSHSNRMTGLYRRRKLAMITASALFDPFPKCTELLLKPRRFSLLHIFPIQL